MQGKIIKGIGGFYYIHVENENYECKAKGIFRKERRKPLVGDNVQIEVLDEEKKLGNITEIMPRMNELVRPAVANVDQALVIFALAEPAPNLNLLDRFLIMMAREQVETIICFNKMDIVKDSEIESFISIYEKSGHEVLVVSSRQEIGMQKIHQVLSGKTTVLAGPSGVGKSSVVNQLYPSANMQTGDVSEKIKRGKHTTRHSELFSMGDSTYLMDTPGFSSLAVPDVEKEQLKDYFTEFDQFENECKYQGCIHIHEPNCRVKEMVELGVISGNRYKNYLQMYEELNERKRY